MPRVLAMEEKFKLPWLTGGAVGGLSDEVLMT